MPPFASIAAIAPLEAWPTLKVTFLRGERFGAGDQPHAVERAADHAGRDQGVGVDHRLVVELAGVDRLPGCGRAAPRRSA